jgi:hypothetical protein
LKYIHLQFVLQVGVPHLTAFLVQVSNQIPYGDDGATLIDEADSDVHAKTRGYQAYHALLVDLDAGFVFIEPPIPADCELIEWVDEGVFWPEESTENDLVHE